MAAQTLTGVNVPPAQTWNYLRINDISLELPAVVSKGTVPSRLPRLFSQMECGLGKEAVSWIEASAGDARYVEVPRGTTFEEPILVDVASDGGEVHDLGVLLREGASATVVVAAHGTGTSAAASSAALVRVIVERGAHLKVVEILSVGDGNQHLEGLGIQADDDSSVEIRQYALGGARRAVGLAVDLAGKGASLRLDSRYLVGGHDLLDINHVVRQRGRNTRCDIVTQGLLEDAAHKTLRETIDLVHGAKGAKGNEVETVLVAGDEVVNKTLPVILCDEDDVAGNHGASIGSVSPEQLAYLAGRGLSEDEATKLFARAILDDAAIHAPEGVSLACALERAEQVLGAEMAHDAADALGLEPTNSENEEASA